MGDNPSEVGTLQTVLSRLDPGPDRPGATVRTHRQWFLETDPVR